MNSACNKRGTYKLKDVLKIHEPEKHEYILDKNVGRISLVLVKVEVLCIYYNEGKWKADFIYNGVRYSRFSVTDKE